MIDKNVSQKTSGAEVASLEYDQIAEKYQEATKRPSRKLILEPSIIKNLGDITDKRVLDLACGEGYSSRLCIELGAKEVIGIDISAKEIEMANKIGNPEHKGQIKYIVGNAAGELPNLGNFDVVTAVMLLQYCSSQEMIKNILQNVRSCLSPSDSFFLTSMPNPDIMNDYEGYGVKLKREKKDEGSLVKVTLSDFETGKILCSFSNYFWSKETYDRIFKEEGFDLQWNNASVSPEGIKKYGKEFWKKFEEKPTYKILKAKLKI